MINRACERSVPEAADRADIQRRYEAVLTVEARLAGGGPGMNGQDTSGSGANGLGNE
jgi:hypothetical protein